MLTRQNDKLSKVFCYQVGLEPGSPGSGTSQSTRQWLGNGVEPGCQPCQRGACVQGDCHPTGHRGFTCTCHPGWTGTLCDQQVSNPCDGNKCVHGTCLPINSYSYSCRCQPGFAGVLCDEQDHDTTNLCSLSLCKHGKCRVSGLGKAYCECNSGYTGESCDRASPELPINPTQGATQRWPAEGNGSEMSTRDSKATRRAKPRRRSPV
ncbi:uncharacterized protein PAE49_003460 [Odontesthes bonariensis]|uniref:uncharacterized protein LOC142378119 n=1 Tax=Odontesthes bonariensis TaxID=219752 RepID=UPI003F584824